MRPEPLLVTRFVLDVHLGRLARYLRLAGFDTDYDAHRDDQALARASSDEARILLTRDRGVLKRGEVSHGYLVRANEPKAQFVEVLRRFDLGDRLAPFTRCFACNGMLPDATEAEVAARAPAPVRVRHRRLRACRDCGRVYWEGMHHARLARLVEEGPAPVDRAERDISDHTVLVLRGAVMLGRGLAEVIELWAIEPRRVAEYDLVGFGSGIYAASFDHELRQDSHAVVEER